MLDKLKEDLLELRLRICRYYFKDNFHEDPFDCIEAKKQYMRYLIKKMKLSCLECLPKIDTIGTAVIIYTFSFFIILNVLGILIYNDFFSIEAIEVIEEIGAIEVIDVLGNIVSVNIVDPLAVDHFSIKIVKIEDKFKFIFIEKIIENISEEEEITFLVNNSKDEIEEEEEEEEIDPGVEAYNTIIIDEKDIPIPEVLIKFREEEAEKLKEKVDLVFIEYVYSIFERANDNLEHIIKIMFDIAYEELMNFICSIDSYFIDCINYFKSEKFIFKFIHNFNIYSYFNIFVILFFFFFFIIFSIHSLFSLYSVYIDYFQKTSIQSNSTTGFIPICIIFILLFFIFFCIFYFIFKLYYIKLLWIMFF